jgi:hypothetical protein
MLVLVFQLEDSCLVEVAARSTCSGGFAPDYVAKIGWPSGSVDAGRKESRVDKIEMVCRKGETAVQVIDLFGTR